MIAPTPFFSDRGCHVRILEEARALERAGATVAICTYFLGDTPEALTVHRAGGIPGYHKRSAGPAWGKLALDARLWNTVRRVEREFQPQVLHAHLHEGMAIAAALRTRARKVLDVQGSLTEETLQHGFVPEFARPALERVERRIVRAAHAVVTSHDAAAAELTERFGVPRERVHVVGDAGTLGPARPERTEALRAAWNLPADAPVVVYAGLLAAHQGTEVLLDLARALERRGKPGIVLAAGYPEAVWRDAAESLGLGARIRFTGRFSYLDLPHLLALGTVAVSPKTSATEGNQKLCAYLEAGLPTVAFATPASRDILEDSGVLVENGDTPAFVRAVTEVLDQTSFRSALAMRARVRAAVLGTWDDVARRIVQAYAL